MDNELRRTLSLKHPYLGESELHLCYLKSAEKTEAAISERIEEWRKPFEARKTANMGSASFATAESWKEIARESDKAARAELMKSSSELAELNELERQAEELRQRAEAKNAELSRLWSEYNAIPDRIHAAQNELNSIKNGLVDLDPAKLRDDFKRHYKAILNGAISHPLAETELVTVIVTADLRKEVLEEKAGELEAQLVELRKRNKELGKRLGRK
jgi:hypothetical protein